NTSAAANIAAFVLVASSFGPTLALSALPANLTQTFASARRLFSVLDAEPAVEERGTEQCAYDGMSLDGVTFGYGDGAPVLRDVTMDIPLSGILGIQGPSGRGKSTLLKLLMRYWDPQQGTVSMSGHALPAIDAHTRRR
ncbi:ATP-binding cassette domain-containing protein, partial [Bifidobacterium longum]|uniref:ATP-binding cassette domain-containing protein n=1 Tax=Bifidobacterium longum TaxID=216816 RepID=UPI001BCBA25E